MGVPVAQSVIKSYMISVIVIYVVGTNILAIEVVAYFYLVSVF